MVVCCFILKLKKHLCRCFYFFTISFSALSALTISFLFLIIVTATAPTDATAPPIVVAVFATTLPILATLFDVRSNKFSPVLTFIISSVSFFAFTILLQETFNVLLIVSITLYVF